LTNKKTPSKLSEAILEMAQDQHRLGVMDDATYRKITIRHLGLNAPATSAPISGDEIRTLRERANLSQAAFISQLERGVKQPKGPALTLFNVIRRKGFEALL